MTEKRKSFVEIFNKNARDFLNQARDEGSGGLLDEIPKYGVDEKLRDQESIGESCIRLTEAPKPTDIDYGRTTDDMVINGKPILKDGHHVVW